MEVLNQIVNIFITQRAKIISAFFGAFIVATFFWAVTATAQGIEKAYLVHFTDAEDYITYYSIEPKDDEVSMGQDIFFVSDKERRQVLENVKWNEKLFCKDEDGNFVYHSSLIDELDQAKILERDSYTYRWTQVVNFETECRRIGITTITLKYGVKKYIRNESKLLVKIR